MKRRQFLKSTAALAGTATLGVPGIAGAQAAPEVIRVGHLVGICMSPLFYADALDLFKAEGLKVELKFMPNPGDALTAVMSGAQHIVHIPFTNVAVAANNGAPLRIISGSGAGGLWLLAQGSAGIKSIDDLKKAKGKGLKVGAMRLNTFEMMLYRLLANNGLSYGDFNMAWFNDTLSLAAAFEAKAIDLVTHVEPFTTRMVDKMGGVPLASSLDVWGKDGPDCVTNAHAEFVQKYPDATRRYIRVLLKADAAIKADQAKAVDILDKGKYYRVDKETLRAALPRQMPQVDLTQGGEKGMRIALDDMQKLGYIKQVPPSLIDLKYLRDALKA